MTSSNRKSIRPKKGREDGWRVLQDRDFRLLWAGQAVAQVGDGLIKVALLWFVYKLTGSAMKMTFIGLLQTIPPLLLSPLIGVYLDRLPKKPVMIGADILRATLLVLIPSLHGLNALSLEGLYALVFLIAVVGTAFGPALSASVPLLVHPSKLTSANALIQSTATMGVILGPVISGTGMAFIGAQNMLYVGAPAFLIAAGFLVPIHFHETTQKKVMTGAKSVWQDMVAGFRYVWTRQPAIRIMLAATALHSVVASAFVFLLPVFADQSLHVGPAELGWLWSAYGGGMLAAAAWLTLAKARSQDSQVGTVTFALIIGAVAAGGLALIPAVWTGILLNGVIGISLGMFTPVMWSLLQEMVPADMRGRVFAMVSTIAMSASLIGMMAFGWSAEKFGATASLIGMAVTLGLTSLCALLLKIHPLRSMPSPAHSQTVG